MADSPGLHPQQEAVAFEVSSRGFKHCEAVADTYNGTVRVYESSSAEEPCIWLSVTHGPHMEAARAAANLTLAQALRVAAQIQWLAANHYQTTDALAASSEKGSHG